MRRVQPGEWARLQQAEPYLRWGLRPHHGPDDTAGGLDVWRADDDTGLVAVLRRRRSGGTRTLHVTRLHTGSAPAEPAARALVDLAAELIPGLGATGLTVPRSLAVPVSGLLPEALPGLQVGVAAGAEGAAPPEGIGWDWMWTTSRLPGAARDRADAAVASARLTHDTLDVAEPAVAAELRTLLDAESPRHSAEPGDQQVRRWFGLRTPSGELAGSAAWYEAVPGIPLLASVAVRSDHRGRGLGVALMVAVTEAAFGAGCQAVTVDLYADNPVARNLYRSLGFTLEQEFASWWLATAPVRSPCA